MKVAVFSTKPYDRKFLDQANTHHEIVYFDTRLEPKTASLAADFPAVCVFVNDNVGAETLQVLAEQGTRLVALRCTGFNNVDLETAFQLGIKVVRVEAYSPYSVAEHTVGLILMLNRKLYRAYNRVRDDNFTLDGLLGFDLHGCSVGILGTGKIGLIFAQIMAGFGCQLLGYDVYPNPEFAAIAQARYVDLPELFAQADIISLHCPLLPETHNIINAETISQMKDGVMLINTSRGKLVDTQAVIKGIRSGKVGYFGIDVYEEEDELFFADWSDRIIQDDTFQLLQSFPNVVITSHQAFFTKNALNNIFSTTIASISDFERGNPLKHELTL
ncbi:2-hydroxyacid dehydrogenase [Candidatus Synechococcus calcipolaris G9]|uniref:2-hydroxyacid dehydrogenase n=1 Tax=Candidatus Synechococcus calcipolaris G9 TaxID=1497997 RepID=A0ABT6EY65_9SYNE|nr:2-hydroxyacid dehydrogenase [Candidatus Synechococcus calcipolaris]MDG2990745.1 2-hydroxyacid dehydrogenase [Candidatus Synechococcus calcipolaris G9]